MAMAHRTGATVVMMRKFDAEDALRQIERHRATHSQWVPTMFVRMLKLDASVRASYDVSSLRSAVHAAAPCPVDVKRAMIDWWGPILLEYYSATEMNGVTMIDSDQWLERPGSVGQSRLGVVRVCDDDGRELATGRSERSTSSGTPRRSSITTIPAARRTPGIPSIRTGPPTATSAIWTGTVSCS